MADSRDHELPFRSPWGALGYAQRFYVRHLPVLLVTVLPAPLLWELFVLAWGEWQEVLGWLQDEAYRVGNWPLSLALNLVVDLVVGTLVLAVFALPLGLLAHAVGEPLSGRSMSLGRVFRAFGARLGHYGITMVLLAGIFAVADLVGMVMGPVRGLVTTVAAVLIVMILPFLPAITVWEGIRGAKALNRSYELLRMSFLPTMLLWPLYFVLPTYANWLAHSRLLPQVSLEGEIALGAVGMAFVVSWIGTMLSLLYFEALAAHGDAVDRLSLGPP